MQKNTYYLVIYILFSGNSCTWTRQRLDHSGKPLGYGPIYDWSCESAISKENTSSTQVEKCYKRCHQYKSCQECLGSSGGAEAGKYTGFQRWIWDEY